MATLNLFVTSKMPFGVLVTMGEMSDLPGFNQSAKE